MEKKKRKALWRGLSSLMCFILAFSILLGNILEANAGTIDTYLGTLSEVTVSENTEENPLYDKFAPPAELLNEDGTGNSTALIQAAMDLNRREVAEGAVLLKNDNNVLPLSSGSNVTLLGIRSHVNLLGSSFGVKAQGPYISLEQALSQNRTDFANTITTTQNTNATSREVATSVNKTMESWTGEEFDFEGAGFNVNPTMVEIYDKLNETYNHANNENAEEVYNPGEPSVEEIAAVNGSYQDSFAQYGDAAIVVLGRPSAESKDFLPGGIAEGLDFEHDEPLSLTQNELDAVELAKQCSDKVIVLISSSSSVEIGTLKNDPEVDAIMWIGAPGCYGMLGVADILCGRVSPSGGLFDIFTTYNMSAPAMQNMGKMYYTNTAEEITRTGGVLGFVPGAYTIEAEGIYVGYRYYETRYYDAVAGTGNATDPTGAYASTTEWNYDNEVTYGFGYGMSYTDFSFAFEGEPQFDISTDPETGAPNAYATFNVRVTNTGDVAGKTPVQIYGQAPYTPGGVEKSAIQLLNFEKSSELQPGESEVIPVKVDLQYIASYDETYDNGDGTTGTYIMDPGDYYFSVGNGAHDALNHIMAAQGMDATRMVGVGNAQQAYMVNITEDFISKTMFSVSKTGYPIHNQLPYADWNYYQPGEVTYLSRTDWAGTYPKSYDAMTLTNEELINNLNGKTYTLQTSDDTSDIVWGADNGIQFYEMYGVPYDDPKWDQLLDQLTLEEAMYIFSFGGPSIPGADSIGTVETYMTENAGNGIAVALNASKDPNAPWAIPASDVNGSWHPEVFANAPIGASTFNPELMYELGVFTGIESLFTGINILWGPGLNTHRHAYNGRNGEYYSEDPVLSGVAAMEFAIGALEYGLVAAPKHFAFNDQESERGGVSPYMTEQRAREVELRAYQIAFEATKYDTEEYDAGMRGLMTSFSKIGSIECTTSEGLMTEILANEWGFIGYAVTDIYDDVDLWTAVLNSGTTCFDTRGQSGFYGATTLESSNLFQNLIEGVGLNAHLIDGDANLQLKLKDAVHKNIYAWTESHLMNRYNATTHTESQMTWWRATYYAVGGISAVLMVASAAMYVLSSKGKKK
ncbi:glycoside hydrolase family 3 C-terminal domain-containing protein [Pseudoflavonifractor phocaeensis]|uniref:glycoside hydrolase family 3 C-terminal domain-containing protein n=1 Tax=Pseudoflavonifractor phocaeensis TaxID=1870988 RepID=UPI00195BB88A|nr:glycoside hydrolase family 3 C-terminal domain-containing protein [Pseudoflavonifractor phocaeensis]MBM6937898.1 glycoside hydrolase family 3 C-terminal domain-containing protein [Pseudoflavonifractor phocaeensis]